MRRRRLRNLAKWGCTVAAVLMVGLGVFSLFRTVVFLQRTSTSPEPEWSVAVIGGRFWLQRFGVARTNEFPPGISVDEPLEWSWGFKDGWRGGFLWNRVRDNHGVPLPIWTAGVTLLYPFLLAAIPAGLMWFTDRRVFGAHACQKCGYDRRGLAAGAKCPECGVGPSARSEGLRGARQKEEGAASQVSDK